MSRCSPATSPSRRQAPSEAKGAGGKLAAGPFEMGEVGRIAILADPQWAYISAYQPESEGPGAEGVFVWDELGTTDADDAQRFYGAVFGWTTSDTALELLIHCCFATSSIVLPLSTDSGCEETGFLRRSAHLVVLISGSCGSP